MNTTELQKKLMAAARSTAPDDRVPYAFEKRIMALLASAKPLDAWTLWGHALWRAAVSCVAVTLLAGAWTVWSGHRANTHGDYSEEFETAALVVADSADETW